jgi:hypothetical protein
MKRNHDLPGLELKVNNDAGKNHLSGRMQRPIYSFKTDHKSVWLLYHSQKENCVPGGMPL